MNQKVEPLPSWLRDADLAAHAFDQLLADRQAQPGAAEAAGHRGIRLGEFLEQALAHAFGHADAGVRDFETQRHLAVGVRHLAQLDRHLQRHAAVFGEFDAVAEQVEQDLAQPGGIAAIDAARRRLDIQSQVDVLFPRLGDHQRRRRFPPSPPGRNR